MSGFTAVVPKYSIGDMSLCTHKMVSTALLKFLVEYDLDCQTEVYLIPSNLYYVGLAYLECEY